MISRKATFTPDADEVEAFLQRKDTFTFSPGESTARSISAWIVIFPRLKQQQNLILSVSGGNMMPPTVVSAFLGVPRMLMILGRDLYSFPVQLLSPPPPPGWTRYASIL
mmetsp:Transcript_19669/g.27007  ORF Transcript_19669/g.27007 Transcript_19669/m.27007 type:complete len:109 (+) Transcript_19669:1192-1518(+)